MNRRARNAGRAFTLVELMVSLVAGLIVTIAVVGLARTATTSFYEEARLSTVEATVRTASERLRQDLSRTSFMSTGNIQLARNNSTTAPPFAVPFGQRISVTPTETTGSRYGAYTVDLQGIRIYVGGSLSGAQGVNALSTVNKLDIPGPDRIDLTGNFTTDDSYRGRMVGNNSVEAKASDDPAVARLLSGPDPDRALRNAFTPGVTGPTALPFLARVVDPRGCSHFVILSALSIPVAGTAKFTFKAADDGANPVLSTTEDQSTCGATPQEEVTINPVQTVSWYIGATSAALTPDPAVEPFPTNKFDLYREIKDASGTSIPAPGGPQVVAEYAIDMKFGITVDDPAAGVAPANHEVFDMDADSVKIGLWTQQASLTTSGSAGPQRVRSVRFRLATRAALPDRTNPLTLLPTQPYYISRYCLQSTAPCKSFARARTIMSEVALTNQAGMTY